MEESILISALASPRNPLSFAPYQINVPTGHFRRIALPPYANPPGPSLFHIILRQWKRNDLQNSAELSQIRDTISILTTRSSFLAGSQSTEAEHDYK